MPRILVLDDDKFVRTSIRAVLENAGYDVVDCDDGYLAIEWHRAAPFDVAIVDLIMPIKEGLETICELQREFPDLPVIAISGGGSVVPADYVQAAKAFGANGMLEKPFDNHELLSAVRENIPAKPRLA